MSSRFTNHVYSSLIYFSQIFNINQKRTSTLSVHCIHIPQFLHNTGIYNLLYTKTSPFHGCLLKTVSVRTPNNMTLFGANVSITYSKQLEIFATVQSVNQSI